MALEDYYGKKAVILIDEYDVPLEASFYAKEPYYDKMVTFIRTLFGNAMKTNPSLDFAVITGCLRVSKESIFTGINNFECNTTLDRGGASYFGLTQEEVDQALGLYGLSDKSADMKRWYNGYLFGDQTVYNPWSSIRYIKDARLNPTMMPVAYWANTSSNDIVRDLIDRAGEEEVEKIEALLRGETITAKIHLDITYEEVNKKMEYLWNFLFFTGYLKKVEDISKEGEGIELRLAIPDWEVRMIFKDKIRDWFYDNIEQAGHDALYEAILAGDADTMTDELNDALCCCVSYMDTAENFYHGFMMGILSGLSKKFEVRSNRENWDGRSVVTIASRGARRYAAIVELKVAAKAGRMEESCETALRQIAEKGYDRDLADRGYRKILHYGVAFCGKECLVKKGDDYAAP
jgi:hypothetical protein